MAWLAPDGGAVAWDSAQSLVAVLYQPARGAAPADRVLLALHAGRDPLPLHLPAPRPGHRWVLLADSAAPDRGDIPPQIAPRSVLLLAEAEHPRQHAADEALLQRLAGAAGIATDWHDLGGQRHAVPRATLEALLATLQLPAAARHRRGTACAAWPRRRRCRRR